MTWLFAVVALRDDQIACKRRSCGDLTTDNKSRDGHLSQLPRCDSWKLALLLAFVINFSLRCYATATRQAHIIWSVKLSHLICAQFESHDQQTPWRLTRLWDYVTRFAPLKTQSRCKCLLWHRSSTPQNRWHFSSLFWIPNWISLLHDECSRETTWNIYEAKFPYTRAARKFYFSARALCYLSWVGVKETFDVVQGVRRAKIETSLLLLDSIFEPFFFPEMAPSSL